MIWVLFSLGFAFLGLFLYWALIVTEGVYLGQRVVTWLYNLTPGYYDRIKTITWKRDAETLVEPMWQWLDGVEQPFILDVGTGTGRFPKAMLDDARFDGEVWGLDISSGMLGKARQRLAEFVDTEGANNCTLFLGDADRLPFGDEYFDAVVCLETLEFTPDPRRTIDELMRVLGPDGVLLITNRIGRARWFPGRAYNDDELIDLLSQYPITRLEIHSWNSFYDQVWVRKADID
ncbi:MAG: class I SAM-dependent methyltransferase [Anaerolineae bacterium]|nr:class I SAM-dependent methyltransferase [Anaerolineae bacterium]